MGKSSRSAARRRPRSGARSAASGPTSLSAVPILAAMTSGESASPIPQTRRTMSRIGWNGMFAGTGRHWPSTGVTPCSRALAASSRSSLDLPIPASPTTSTTCPRPRAAVWSRFSSSASSSRRPTRRARRRRSSLSARHRPSTRYPNEAGASGARLKRWRSITPASGVAITAAGSAARRSACSRFQASPLASASRVGASGPNRTRTSAACNPMRRLHPSEVASRATFLTARAVCAARTAGSSMGSIPNAANSAVGLSVSTRPPKLRTLSPRSSGRRRGGASSLAGTRRIRSRAMRRDSQRG